MTQNQPDLPLTISQVLAEIKKQLDWRGPNGRTQGVLTLTRAEAEYWYDHSLLLMKERDELVAEKNK